MKEHLNTAVFTTKNVMNNHYLITRVYHHNDGSWQLFDDISTNSNANIMIVGLKEIIEEDNSIKNILNLPEGKMASRINKNDTWKVQDNKEEKE